MAVYDIDVIEKWFSAEQISRRTLGPEEVLFHRHDAANAFYLVTDGEFRVESYLPNGQTVIFFRARKGAVLAEENVHFDEHLYTAVANVKSTVVSVTKADFLDRYHSDKAFCVAIFSCISQRYSDALMLREILAIKSASQRLLAWLMWKQTHGQEIDLKGQMGAIAPELGLTKESVYRAFSSLEDDGVIRRRDGRVELLEG